MLRGGGGVCGGPADWTPAEGCRFLRRWKRRPFLGREHVQGPDACGGLVAVEGGLERVDVRVRL